MPQGPEQEGEPEPKQIQLMRHMVELAVQRNEMSAERSYMNAERTLSVWVRTALGLMAFGVALDRFGLFLDRSPAGKATLDADALSAWGGIALVAMGIVVAVTAGARFVAYGVAYRRDQHAIPYHHGPFLAPFFALMTALFGLALVALLVWLTPILQI